MCNVIDPLSDDRWENLVASHPNATAFHQRGWLEALARTYDYRPAALTSAAKGETLKDGLVLCHVASWLTGSRLVSLPFADHCEPLLNEPGQMSEFTSWLRSACETKRWSYVQLRPMCRIEDPNDGFEPSASYHFHWLDLSPNVEEIFGKLHKNSIQRRIRRAEKKKKIVLRSRPLKADS